MRAVPTITLGSHTVYGKATSIAVHSKYTNGFSLKINTSSGTGNYYTNGGTYEADAEL